MNESLDLLRPQEAARQLGITEKTLRRWRSESYGPNYVRIGQGPRGRVAYRLEDLFTWLEQRAGVGLAPGTRGDGA